MWACWYQCPLTIFLLVLPESCNHSIHSALDTLNWSKSFCPSKNCCPPKRVCCTAFFLKQQVPKRCFRRDEKQLSFRKTRYDGSTMRIARFQLPRWTLARSGRGRGRTDNPLQGNRWHIRFQTGSSENHRLKFVPNGRGIFVSRRVSLMFGSRFF